MLGRFLIYSLQSESILAYIRRHGSNHIEFFVSSIAADLAMLVCARLFWAIR